MLSSGLSLSLCAIRLHDLLAGSLSYVIIQEPVNTGGEQGTTLIALLHIIDMSRHSSIVPHPNPAPAPAGNTRPCVATLWAGIWADI